MVKRCCFPDCQKKILSLALDCDKCHQFYCSTHRLPEDHICLCLDEMKKRAYEANREVLEGNKLVNSQVNF